MAQDLLREPEFRDWMRALVRVAFEELHQPAPPDDKRGRIS